MKRLNLCIGLFVAAALLPVSAAPRDEFLKVVENFLDAADHAGAALGEEGVALRSVQDLEAGALTAALRRLHPEFAEGLRTAAASPEDGIIALEQLAADHDPFLAAESSYYLSRVLIGQERFEEALAHLKKIRYEWAAHSLRSGEALYYLGVCNANMLQRTAAADNLNDFVEGYPDAAPRLLGSAWDLIASIERVDRGSIDDVAGHMEFSRRKLGLVDPGGTTQEVQGRIIVMLDELIERAEEQEKQQQGSGSGPGSAATQGSAAGQGSGEGNVQGGNSSAQDAPRVVRRIRGAAESAWDDLRERDRGTDALGALKSKYPARYRQLVDQYYRSVQEGDEGGDDQHP